MAHAEKRDTCRLPDVIFAAVLCSILLCSIASGGCKDEPVGSGNRERIKGIFSGQRKKALLEVLAVFHEVNFRDR